MKKILAITCSVLALFVMVGCDTYFFEENQTLSFADIETVDINVDDVFVSIIESNVEEITVTSTVENKGIGFITQPKIRIEGNTLYFEQGALIGYNTRSSGELTIEVPVSLELGYSISNGSGDVLLEVSSAKDMNFDMAVGELDVYTSCENFTANTVSGDINIYGSTKNITVDTVSSDVSLSANAITEEINFESVSGDCTIYSDELGGYNLNHSYAGGNIDEYIELSSDFNNTINITADTVDGEVEIFDRSMLDSVSNFLEDK